MSGGIHFVARDEPGRLAIVAGERRIGYGELEASIVRAAAGLAAAGVGPGDRVAMLLTNRPEYFVVWNAATRLGALAVPIGYRSTAAEAAYVLGDSGARLLVHDCPGAAEPAARETGVPAWAVDGPELLAHDGSAVGGDFVGAMPGAMQYTSGTTGRPKGIVRRAPAPAPERQPNPMAGVFGYGPADVHLVCGPLYHTAPSGHALMNLWEGATVVLPARFDATTALELIERERVTSSFMAPAHFLRILEADWARHDRSSVQRIWHAGAPCPPAVKRRILEVFPGAVWEFFGASEGLGGIISPDEWAERPGSVGKAFPGLAYRILDEAGNELPPGEVGLVYTSSFPGTEFAYHNAEEKTAGAWRDGFFTVGDMGWLDADGYLYLADRRTDLILRNGVNVYPAEIEHALAEHPDVVDSAVFGLPDERTGQRVHAVVELRPGAARDAGALVDHLRPLLASHKLPATVEFVDVLPREPNGKVLKRVLREQRIGATPAG